MLKSLVTVVFGVLGIILSFRGQAQNEQNDPTDSLTHLDEVVITNTRLQAYAMGHYMQCVDTMTSQLAVATNAAELLRKFGYGHIRSYGVGGVTTPSFRGTGASHTAVLWNGINIISPLNGQSDLSLLPVNFIDDIQLQSGGSATLYGSGAIGGTIQFNNKARFGQGLDLSLTGNVGSFETFFHGLSAGWSGKRWISSTRVFKTTAENNFLYTNKYVFPVRREVRQHNAYEQQGLLQQNYFQVNKRQLLSLRFWVQDNHVEIPEPITVLRDGTDIQRDKFFRSMIGWNYDYNKGHVFIQSAHVNHALDFSGSVSTFNSFINVAENTLNINDHLEWTSGVNYTFEAWKGVTQRNRTALYSAVKHEKGKLLNVLSARQEFVNNWLSPFSPSLAVEYRAHRVISLFGNISRNYRIPTFNDLYWNDAGAKGNPDLRMERSWSEEAGLRLSLLKSLTGQLAVFSNQVDDMIYWRQTEQAIWSPRNVEKVWSRGIETNGTFKKSIFELTGRYSYTRSTPQSGKQLVYTPRHESGVTARVTWRGWSLSFTNNYTGRQYTEDSNNEYYALRGYNLANIWLSKNIDLNKMTILVTTEANNIFDEQVSARIGYPLPGINFKAGITIRFNKPIQQ
ncbi:MAG TPA: TonB-dependent receptor [Cyclobacteriaceae bacterium]|nr:TonB-dependent receptor [Cyclobacteriaceae bacterium]